MASRSFLAVPSKSTKGVEFGPPFSRFIGSTYEDAPSKYHEPIREFAGLRESTVVRSPDKHETGLDLITRWREREWGGVVCVCVCVYEASWMEIYL